jgi:hypothetical protein
MPPLRWAGSRRTFLPEINLRRLVEPGNSGGRLFVSFSLRGSPRGRTVLIAACPIRLREERITFVCWHCGNIVKLDSFSKPIRTVVVALQRTSAYNQISKF